MRKHQIAKVYPPNSQVIFEFFRRLFLKGTDAKKTFSGICLFMYIGDHTLLLEPLFEHVIPDHISVSMTPQKYTLPDRFLLLIVDTKKNLITIYYTKSLTIKNLYIKLQELRASALWRASFVVFIFASNTNKTHSCEICFFLFKFTVRFSSMCESCFSFR